MMVTDLSKAAGGLVGAIVLLLILETEIGYRLSNRNLRMIRDNSSGRVILRLVSIPILIAAMAWTYSEFQLFNCSIRGTVVNRGTGLLPGRANSRGDGYWLAVESAEGGRLDLQVTRDVYEIAQSGARITKDRRSLTLNVQKN